MAEFTIEAFQNEYLPEGHNVMDAVITVTAAGTSTVAGLDSARAGAERSEVIIIDTSGSMYGTKLREAQAATAAAIDCLPDGVHFALIAGNHEARVVFPLSPQAAVASFFTREEAKRAVKKLKAAGGTAMGGWLHLAAYLFGDSPGIRHAILLTDGKNESEAKEVFEEALSSVEGAFQCDCRGVGADWSVDDLRTVATTLLGTYDIVADPADLSADFADMMNEALSKQVAEVTLRVWTPQGAEVTLLKQMEPVMLDLSGARTASVLLSGDYATGSWGDESRDYHLSVRLPMGSVNDEMLAARVTVLVGDEPRGQALVRAVWTDDAAMSTRINKRVAEVKGEGQLADAIQAGIDALRSGDVAASTDQFGAAVQLATEQENDEALDRLSGLVDIEDGPTGRVRPKAKVADVDMMILETRSTRTTRNKK